MRLDNSRLYSVWLTADEAAKYCKMHKVTLKNYTRDGTIPVSKAHGKNMYRRRWLDKWLEDGSGYYMPVFQDDKAFSIGRKFVRGGDIK